MTYVYPLTHGQGSLRPTIPASGMGGVLFAALFACCGCATSTCKLPSHSVYDVLGSSYSVTVSLEVMATDVALLREAISSWELALEGDLTIASVHVGECESKLHELCVRSGDEFSSLGRTVRNVVFDNAVITVRAYRFDAPSYTAAQMIAVYAHELGHGMGLQHSCDGTLMCCSIECAAPRPTKFDVQQWRYLRR